MASKELFKLFASEEYKSKVMLFSFFLNISKERERMIRERKVILFSIVSFNEKNCRGEKEI